MLHVVSSNRTEALLDALAERVRAERPGGARALDPVHLVVPTRTLESHLRMGLAERLGVAANLRVHFLERLFGGLGDEAALLGRGALETLCLDVLCDDDALAHEDLAPLQRWLDAAPDTGGRDGRRVEVALELGRLFAEYASSRPEWLRDWTRQPVGGGDTERIQRRLWKQLVAPRGPLDRLAAERGVRPLLLAEQLERLPATLPRALHVFAFSYMSPLYHRALATLAGRTDVVVYAPNPCRQFWMSRDPEVDATLVGAWGRPGREHLAALGALTEWSSEDHFVEPQDEGALASVQRALLDLAPLDGVRPDASLRLLACPSVRREVEAVADEIWALLRAHPELPPREIAVLLPPAVAEEYLPHVLGVFAESHGLPCHVVDLDPPSARPVLEIARLLVELPRSRLARPDVLAVLGQRAVIGALGGADPADLAATIDALGIFSGADSSALAGTYAADEARLHWDQGLTRLALGTLVPARGALPTREGPAEVPPVPLDEDAVLRLCALARAVLAEAGALVGARLPLGAWGERFAALVRQLVAPETPEDLRDLALAEAALAELGTLDVSGRAVPYRVAAPLAVRALGGIERGRGGYAPDAVVVSSFVPMRALPFDATFVLGLGEATFPAPDRPAALDLRAAERRLGDVSPRERDQFLLLETLAHTRRFLRLSWVARDARSGDPLEPSPLVSELLAALAPVPAAQAAWVRRPPLHRHDPELHPALWDLPAVHPPVSQPEAVREAQALALRGTGGERARVLASRVEVAPVPTREAVQITTGTLRRFLRAPLQAAVGFHLGLHEDDIDDLRARADEPFALGPLERTILVGEITAAMLREGPAAAEMHLHARMRQLGRSGRAPVGTLGAAAAAAVLAAAQRGTVRARAALPEARWESLASEHFGFAPEDAPEGAAVHPALRLEIALGDRTTAVEIVGPTGILLPDLPASVVVLARKPEDRDLLGPLVDHALRSATGRAGGEHTVLRVPVDGGTTERTLAALGAADARAWLTSIVAELLAGPPPERLPVETALAVLQKGDADALAALVTARTAVEPSEQRGPVRHPERVPPPASLERAREIALRRFRPLVAGAAQATLALVEEEDAT